MAATVELEISLTVRDTEGRVILTEPSKVYRWTPASGLPKREVVSLTGSAFTALSPPTSAKAVLIYLESGVSITTKGVTGDTGTTVAPASGPIRAPVLLPLGASPSLGLTNGNASAQSVTCIWL